jgi:hypothetical protein
MRQIVALIVLVFAFAAAGCVEAFGDKNPYEPGEKLGTYHVSASQTKNACGDGALGAPAEWEFDVGLSWEDGSVFWNSGGQVIVGTISDDRKTFEIATDVLQDMRTEADAGKPPCSITRHDVASGSFVWEGETATSASGTLSYAFTPTEGSSCGDLITGEQALFAALPCSITYKFKAPRTGE